MEPDNGSAGGPVAAVDLGSNSFHLLIGREIGGQLSVVDRLRDPVRMAAGLDGKGRLSRDTVDRLSDSLRRFRQRLVDIPPERVSAIGTNSFRSAKSPADLLQRSSDELGFPIEILSGLEEARLIHLGVSHEEPRIEGVRLVVDIGGGSTECILGQGFTPLRLDSLYMGCVTYSRRFFPDGRLTRKAFRKAELAAQVELETIQQRFHDTGWSECVGTSGTIKAVAQILRENQWTEGPITLSGIKKLRKHLIVAEHSDNVQLQGLQEDRRPVIAGGTAILKAVFEQLGIESMRASKAALREGLLYDLLGRIRHEDVRDRTIRALAERYAIDDEQAKRVEATALHCLDQVQKRWKLQRWDGRQLLSWAAQTHEIGLAIAYPSHHRHGAYILANSHMPGFSRENQRRLATLVRGHRRRFSPEILSELLPSWREPLTRLCVLLRIAVRLNRTRSSRPLPEFRLKVLEDGLEIRFPEGWLADHPLTGADLEDEDELLRHTGMRLRAR